MERRQALELILKGAAVGAAVAVAPQLVLGEDLEALAKKYIPYMKKPVSVTLNPNETHVKEVTPDNYDGLVYRNNKGSLVLFVRQEEHDEPSRGLASVFRALDEKYNGKLDFFVFYDEKWSTMPGKTRGNKIVYQENIQAPPSIAMYSLFDLLKGETSEKNDGNIKKIDILKGGLVKPDEWILAYKILNEWFNTNILNPNGKYVQRMNNSFNPHKVDY